MEVLAKDVKTINISEDKENKKTAIEAPNKKENKGRRVNRISYVSECNIHSIEELKKQFPENWHQFVQKTARVVFILEAKHSRCSAGYLKLFQDRNPNFALFSPIDSRFPRLKIAKVNCPKDFFNRPQDFQEFLYIGKIIQWDLVPFGMGLLTHNLGSDKDISVRTKGKISLNSLNTPYTAVHCALCTVLYIYLRSLTSMFSGFKMPRL